MFWCLDVVVATQKVLKIGNLVFQVKKRKKTKNSKTFAFVKLNRWELQLLLIHVC